MAGDGDEFSLVPQWLKSSHGLQSPGASTHAAGQQREAWHGRGSSSSSNTTTTNGAGGNGGNSSMLLPLTRSERERERAGHAAWSHFHTSGRSGRAVPFGGRDASANGHSNTADADRFHPLGSPFKSSTGSSFGSSRHGLQRSVSDSGGAVGAADVGPGLGTPQQRDRGHPFGGAHRQAQLQYGYSADDKLSWRDSNRQQQQHGTMHGPAGGRAANKPPPLTALDFPSLTGSHSNTGSSPRSTSSDRLGSPQPYAPSVAPYKQDFLASRGSQGWTSKLADVPGAAPQTTGAAAAAAAAEHCIDAGSAVKHEDSSSGSNGSGGDSGGEAGAAGGDCSRVTAASDSERQDVGAAGPAAGAAAAVGPSGLNPSSSVTPAGGASLADTLKQAVAANAASGSSSAATAAKLEAQRRQSKALVPLLPGSKSKHACSGSIGNGGGGSSKVQAEGRAPATRRLAPVLATAASTVSTAAAGSTSGSNGSHAPASGKTLLSPVSPVTSSSLLTLALPSQQGSSIATTGGGGGGGGGSSGAAAASSSSAPGDGDAHASGAAAAASQGSLPPVSPGAPAGSLQPTGSWVQHASDASHKPSGVAALLGHSTHSSSHQQLADRHSFFGMLKRKSSINQHPATSNSSSSSTLATAATGSTGQPGLSGCNGSSGNSSSSSFQDAGAGAGCSAAATFCDNSIDTAAGEEKPAAPPAAAAVAGVNPSSMAVPAGSGSAPEVQSPQSQQQYATAAAADETSKQPQPQPHQEKQQEGRRACESCAAPPGPASYSLADVADTISFCSSSERGSDHGSGTEGAAHPAAADACRRASSNGDGVKGTTTTAAAAGGAGFGEEVCGSWDVLDKEEEAFLRSLGWSSSDDEEGEGSWGLTQEEIAAFQAAAAAAARSTTAHHRHHHPHHEQHGNHHQHQAAAAAAAGKLPLVSPSVRVRGGVSCSPADSLQGGLMSRTRGSMRAGLCLQGRNGCSIQAPLWAVQYPLHWPPAIAAARIFGGGSSSSEEESDSDGAD